jgi:phenylalanyl-tRNA synthetase beta chain
MRLAALCAGPMSPEQWGMPVRTVDFYDAKADVLALFGKHVPDFVRTEHPALHPGRSAAIQLDGATVGVIGELHPRWVQKYELGTAPILFEVDVACLLTRSLPGYREVSRFPAVVRDLALIVPADLELQALHLALRNAAPALVSQIELFDLYQGRGITEGRKSLAFRIVMQDTQRTLEDTEVDQVVAVLVATAEQTFGAELRR